jgi:inhibitor of growth protein 3
MTHQRHISNLLDASTLLDSAPPSPYTTALTLTTLPTVGLSRRQIARAANSPFGGRPASGAGAGAGEGRTGDTPTKKKKATRVQQLGREDDDASSVGGGRDRKAPAKKKRS